MRIVYLNPSGQMGGAETSLYELLASMRQAEPEWELLLVLGEEGPLAEKARKLRVRTTVCPFPPGLARLGDAGKHPLVAIWLLLKGVISAAFYARRLAGVMRSMQPDLIHTNGFKMHVLGSW